jgi:glycosyltransferase involved in cell wall biosynthesis
VRQLQASGANPPRYAMVTPAYNECKYIAAMINSVLCQTIRPVRWVIIDDGSTDNTAEIVASYARRHDFIDLIRRPKREERRPGGEGIIQQALNRLNLSEYDFLARFDADLILQPDYIARILREFELDPLLGVAGGGLYVEKNLELELEVEPTYHVRGAVKMYRRECFEEIGGLSARIGWDTIDEVYAWIKGWTTRSFVQYRVIHCRPTGFGQRAGRIYWERGRAEYLTWSHPLFVLAKTVKIAVADVAPLKSTAFLAGFVACYVTREHRLQDSTFVRVRRDQQRHRLAAMLHAPGSIQAHQLTERCPVACLRGGSR